MPLSPVSVFLVLYVWICHRNTSALDFVTRRQESSVQHGRVGNQPPPSLSPACAASPDQRGSDTGDRTESKHNSGETGETLLQRGETCGFTPVGLARALSSAQENSDTVPQTGGGPRATSLGESGMWCSARFVFMIPEYFFKEALFFSRSADSSGCVASRSYRWGRSPVTRRFRNHSFPACVLGLVAGSQPCF